MDATLLGIIVAQGVAILLALLRLSFRAGRVLQRIEDHERRIVQLEGNVFPFKKGAT